MRHRHPGHARSSLLAQRAAQMRYQLNLAEAALWAKINAGKLGVVFRRQVVVLGRYIADFLAPSVKLIVEVDGGYHARRVGADARRDEALCRAGMRRCAAQG
jgi:very-short-patch-repair endonuclease